jgi:large subunit ribosomal protein L22
MSISVAKLRLIVNSLVGKNVEEALTILQFMPSPWAKNVAKVVRSAAANAENNFEMDPTGLRIIRVNIGPAPTLKRYYPRARGTAGPNFKRHSNMTVVLDQEAT